jgi:hypothetical protein
MSNEKAELYDVLKEMVLQKREFEQDSDKVMTYNLILEDLEREIPKYIVRVSGYEKPNEKSVEVSGSGKLENLLADADMVFSEENEEELSDRNYEVWLVSADGNKIPVSAEIYMEYVGAWDDF